MLAAVLSVLVFILAEAKIRDYPIQRHYGGSHYLDNAGYNVYPSHRDYIPRHEPYPVHRPEPYPTFLHSSVSGGPYASHYGLDYHGPIDHYYSSGHRGTGTQYYYGSEPHGDYLGGGERFSENTLSSFGGPGVDGFSEFPPPGPETSSSFDETTIFGGGIPVGPIVGDSGNGMEEFPPPGPETSSPFDETTIFGGGIPVETIVGDPGNGMEEFPPTGEEIPPGNDGMTSPFQEIPPGEEFPPGEGLPPGEEFPPGEELPPGEGLPPGEEFPPGEEIPPGGEFPPVDEFPPSSGSSPWDYGVGTTIPADTGVSGRSFYLHPNRHSDYGHDTRYYSDDPYTNRDYRYIGSHYTSSSPVWLGDFPATDGLNGYQSNRWNYDPLYTYGDHSNGYELRSRDYWYPQPNPNRGSIDVGRGHRYDRWKVERYLG